MAGNAVSTRPTILVLSADRRDAAHDGAGDTACDAAGTAQALAGFGYDVPDGVRTLGAVAVGPTDLSPYHLVVLDISPGAVLAGLEAAEQLRAISDLPILLLLSNEDAMEPRFIPRAHAFDCLLKPCERHTLRVSVELSLARHVSKRQLRADDDRYKDLVENSYDLICTHDVDGRLLSVNAAAEKALGYAREALVGRYLQELLVPDMRHLFPAYLAEVLEKGTSHGVMRMSAANGDVREWEYHNSERRLEDGRRLVRGLAHDVTEQLKAARELRASEQRFRALFEQAAVGVAYIDSRSGKILAVNHKCAQILGYLPGEMLALDFPSLLHPEDLPANRELMMQLTQGEVPEFVVEQRLLCKDGTNVWVALSVSPVSRAGAPISRHMAVVQDIAQRKHAEEQRTVLEAQLRQAQKMEAIGRLAGGIAHDFNNQLTTMVGNIELARLDVEPGDAVSTSLDAIALAARRASDLVRQILAFSRKQPSRRFVVPLAPILTDVLRLLRASLPAAIEIELQLEDQAILVRADATQIHQVIMNLCTNSWQAIGQKSGRIIITLDTVEIAPDPAGRLREPSGRCARIRVRDTGDGMDSLTLERIFEPFFTTKEIGRGSGLGLSVAHGIVKGHGGTITAQSREGQGATFEVLLPSTTAASDAIASDTDQPEPRRGRGRVLYVDDEQALAATVSRMLESLGYETTICHSGAEAIARVRANPQDFDVVLTDFSMPGLSGTDVARELVRIRSSLPVILTSGYAEQAGENLAKLGIRLRLDKPFDRYALSNALRHVLENSIRAAS